MDELMGREGAKEMRNLFAGGSESEWRSPCLLWRGDPNSPPCFQAARWCRDRTDLNSCGLPADTALLHPPICPRNLVTKISFLLFCSCFNSVVEPPPPPQCHASMTLPWFCALRSLCGAHTARGHPVTMWMAGVHLWAQLCPHCPLCLTLLLSFLQPGSSL